jgi:hypothetical protein
MQRGSHPFNFWFISVLGWIGVDRAMTTENMSARLHVRPHIHDCVFLIGLPMSWLRCRLRIMKQLQYYEYHPEFVPSHNGAVSFF